jgi:hypothetical protein
MRLKDASKQTSDPQKKFRELLRLTSPDVAIMLDSCSDMSCTQVGISIRHDLADCPKPPQSTTGLRHGLLQIFNVFSSHETLRLFQRFDAHCPGIFRWQHLGLGG